MSRTVKINPRDKYKKSWNYESYRKCVYCMRRNCGDIPAIGDKALKKCKGPGIPKKHLKIDYLEDV